MKSVRSLALLVAALAVGCQPPAKAPSQPVAVTPSLQQIPETPPTPAYTEISMKAQGQRIPVIMYHDVLKARGRGAMWYDVTLDEFKAQLDRIAELGYTPISLDQLYNHLTHGELVPEKSIVLTFDDNYQGFHDYAWPLLKERNYPVAMFVHTGFVGNTTQGRPKMSWDTLKELVKDPLFTVGNHTISHPDDITKLDAEHQKKEIEEAKKKLEEELGRPVPYFAYPNGMNDTAVQDEVRTAGHTMAFSIHNGPAEESPNIVCVNRYVHTRFEDAIQDCEKSVRGGALGVTRVDLKKDAPVKYEEVESDGIKLALITGGEPQSVMSDTREGVRDFVRRTGAVAGINGGFFAMAAIQSTDNRMVGPCKTNDQSSVWQDTETFRWPKLRNRPLIMWSPKEFAIVPFQPETMNTEAAFRDFMPDLTDTFLAGVWLVHDGQAREKDDMNVFASKDIQDYRKRAFLGVKIDGTFVIGATTASVDSARLAQAIAKAGIQEAVLLDSGFSTSLVYGESIKAYGHSSPDNPSRPVPHAVVIKGTLDPETEPLSLADAPVPKQEEDVQPKRKRRRRRRSTSTSTSPSTTTTPDAGSTPATPPDTSTPAPAPETPTNP